MAMHLVKTTGNSYRKQCDRCGEPISLMKNSKTGRWTARNHDKRSTKHRCRSKAHG